MDVKGQTNFIYYWQIFVLANIVSKREMDWKDQTVADFRFLDLV